MVDIPISILMHPNVLSMEKIAGSIRFAPMEGKNRIFLVITPEDLEVGRMVCEIKSGEYIDALFFAVLEAVTESKKTCPSRR